MIVTLVWAITIGVSLALFIAGLGFRIEELRHVSGEVVAALRAMNGSLVAPLVAVIGSGAYPSALIVTEVLLMVALTATALAVYWRRPKDWMSMFLSVTFVGYGVFITPSLDALRASQPQLAFPVDVVVAVGITATLLFFYLIPDGRFVPGWTKWAALIWTIWMAAAVADPTSPFNLSNLRPSVVLGGLMSQEAILEPSVYGTTLAAFVISMGFWLSGVYAQIQRYRRADAVGRSQTKWIVIGLTGAVLGYGSFMLPRIVLPALRDPGLANIAFHLIGVPLYLVVILLVPVFLGFEILRYRLWDIEVIVNRSLVYGSLVVALAAMYAALVVLLGRILAPFVEGSSIAVAAATLIVAALLQPLRERIQKFIDRRFYRAKYDAERTLEVFVARLQLQLELDTLSRDLLSAVDASVQPTYASLWLRPAGEAAVENRPLL